MAGGPLLGGVPDALCTAAHGVPGSIAGYLLPAPRIAHLCVSVGLTEPQSSSGGVVGLVGRGPGTPLALGSQQQMLCFQLMPRPAEGAGIREPAHSCRTTDRKPKHVFVPFLSLDSPAGSGARP